jgi:hypothetical protein
MILSAVDSLIHDNSHLRGVRLEATFAALAANLSKAVDWTTIGVSDVLYQRLTVSYADHSLSFLVAMLTFVKDLGKRGKLLRRLSQVYFQVKVKRIISACPGRSCAS